MRLYGCVLVHLTATQKLMRILCCMHVNDKLNRREMLTLLCLFDADMTIEWLVMAAKASQKYNVNVQLNNA